MNPQSFGDTAAAAWGAQLIDKAVRDVPGGRSTVDMNMVIGMCKADPKSAQVVMQLLSQELKNMLEGRPVSGAPVGPARYYRLMLGSVFMGYCVSRGFTDGPAPPELETILHFNPTILECVSFVSADNPYRAQEPEKVKEKPWWRVWSRK